jgi:hypothetical protein
MWDERADRLLPRPSEERVRKAAAETDAPENGASTSIEQEVGRGTIDEQERSD